MIYSLFGFGFSLGFEPVVSSDNHLSPSLFGPVADTHVFRFLLKYTKKSTLSTGPPDSCGFKSYKTTCKVFLLWMVRWFNLVALGHPSVQPTDST